MIKYLTKNVKVEAANFDSKFKGTVHHREEVMVAEARGHVVSAVRKWGSEEERWCPTCFLLFHFSGNTGPCGMEPLKFVMAVPASINPKWKLPHSYVQRFIS